MVGGRIKTWKRVQNATSKVKLSTNQQEVLNLLTHEYLTVKQIAQKRGITDRAIYKVISKLKSKGVLVGVEQGGWSKGGSYTVTTAKEYRLHAQKFTIEILDITKKFRDILKKQNKLDLDNNTVYLYSNKLVVYSNKDFFGNTVDSCFELSSSYWNNYLRILENHLKIILIKPRKCIIKDFGCHIAKTNDPLAKEVNLSNDSLKVYAPDGKLRLIVDNSFNLNEFETIHKDTARFDMRKVEDFYKDLLENDTLNLSEVKDYLASLQKGDKSSLSRIEKIEILLEQAMELQNTNAILVMSITKEISKWKK